MTEIFHFIFLFTIGGKSYSSGGGGFRISVMITIITFFDQEKIQEEMFSVVVVVSVERKTKQKFKIQQHSRRHQHFKFRWPKKQNKKYLAKAVSAWLIITDQTRKSKKTSFTLSDFLAFFQLNFLFSSFLD